MAYFREPTAPEEPVVLGPTVPEEPGNTEPMTITEDGEVVFSVEANYGALAREFGLFLIAMLYLYLRRFDFRTWNVRFTWTTPLFACLLFLGGALLYDMYFLLTAPLAEKLPFPGPIGASFNEETVSRVIYGLFNGMCEELYFLGICLAVAPKHLKWVFPFSLLVRVGFHTYQGTISALGIGLVLGSFMFLAYRYSKDKNLLPFFLAHSMGDIFGLGVLPYIWS
ncbi:CPBP family glutamic-type intramembrane protease [Actinobaculum sp. 352]|uniref:CPBP family glutamic-type intramembrane protease n=1 Tax=Actinobaculum sp. 352 TaxID=2490946 RepID=UPI000F7F94EE|nr:CPBP family glutamic-type intramembrane protease [Actinobaculum sp. 352]RTE50663.1 CPBP family intramembrane metalloprotease [Actinobaculum sp. 352]